MGFLDPCAIEAMGFAHVGRRVRISDRASFHGAARISIGDDTRIDDFCVLSAGEGGIHIGRHVHIAVFCALIGAERIDLDDFSGLSSRVSVYSSNDDYSGAAMTNPTVPAAFTRVTRAPVHIGRHVIVGSGSVILPGVTLHEGAAVGALSLVRRDCEAFGIYAGAPARRVGERKRDLLALEPQLLAAERGHAAHDES
ncbi:MAG: acyltransferase [Casimicrobiaceae bacterium]